VTYEYKYQQNQSKLNYPTLLLYIILSDIYAIYVDADPWIEACVDCKLQL
jgi:hypothetical protein